MVWFVIAVAVILIGTGYIYYTKLQASKNSTIAIATSRISTGDIVLSATGPGTLIPNQQVSFGFKKSGKISEVLVKLGDHVKTGQVLARVDDPTVQLEYNQKVTNAESTLTEMQNILAKAQNDYTGKYVLQMFIYPVRNSKGVTTSRELFAPTDVEISAAHATYEIAIANLNDAQNYLDVLNGTLPVDQVPASSITPINEAQTAFDQAKANLDATQLTAPIDGIITSITLNVGDNAGTLAAVTISNTIQPYTLDVYLDETDWDKARVGFDASITFDMLPNKNYSGKVTGVFPALDRSSGTPLAHIRVQLNSNINVDLPAGATGSVDIIGGKTLGTVIVPISALKEVQPGKYVVYRMKNNQPVEQSVEIGLEDIVNAEVKSGLKPGDVVMTNSTDKK